MKKLAAGLFLLGLVLFAILYIGQFPESTVCAEVYEPKITSAKRLIELSEGRQIKITGSNFVKGAQVIFNPVLKPIDNEADAESEAVSRLDIWYDLKGGIRGTNVIVSTNGNTIYVDTPAGRPAEIREYSLIVVNPDKTISNNYEGIDDIIDVIGEPKYVDARLINNSFILIHWSKVEGAKEYEVYMSMNSSKTKYLIGFTQNTSFIYDDLKKNTEYYFYVRAVGDFNVSDFSDDSVKTRSKIKDNDTYDLIDLGTIKKGIGGTATVIFNSSDFYDENIIDLTEGDLAGCSNVDIFMPAEIISKYNKKMVKIAGKDINISFNPGVFANLSMNRNVENKEAGVRLQILKVNENCNMGIGQGLLSSQYVIKAEQYDGHSITPISVLQDSMNIILAYDTQKASFRKYSNVKIGRYSTDNNSWESINTDAIGIQYVTASVNRLGKYAVVGMR